MFLHAYFGCNHFSVPLFFISLLLDMGKYSYIYGYSSSIVFRLFHIVFLYKAMINRLMRALLFFLTLLVYVFKSLSRRGLGV
jgi:hypothetical protein